jgi:hypothetical protein
MLLFLRLRLPWLLLLLCLLLGSLLDVQAQLLPPLLSVPDAARIAKRLKSK